MTDHFVLLPLKQEVNPSNLKTMTRKKPHPQASAPVRPEETGAAPISSSKKKKTHFTFFNSRISYLLTFVTLWIFCTFTYGEVFTRTVQESFVTSDTEMMKHLTDQEHGQLYLMGRYCLLMFHNKWIGGLLFSLILTVTARLFDYVFCVPKWLRGISALIPFTYLFFIVQEGISIYYKAEPSAFLLIGLGLFAVAMVLGIIAKIIFSKFFPARAIVAPQGWRKYPIGALVVLLSFVPLNYYAKTAGENTILTAKMQNCILRNEVYSLGEIGLTAERPTRSVAAYCAVGLAYTDQILERLFDINFNFPDAHVDTSDGVGEYGIFVSDCNFYSGLLNASYRSAMDQNVMNGPRLYYLKRMALCAILNQEKELAQKYLDIISKVPFESDFVETYTPMMEKPELATLEPSFNKVISLIPREHKFEQNYRNPTFLGYHVGLMMGSNDALAPSIAACLYSKDLANMAQRAMQYKKMVNYLPLSMQEALSIFGRKNPSVYQVFPDLNDENLMNPAVTNVNNFYLTIQSYFQEKYDNAGDWREQMSKELAGGISDDLRAYLQKDWLGHYVYYYYCENVAKKQEAKKEESGVN